MSHTVCKGLKRKLRKIYDCCQLCGKPFEKNPGTLEHIIPKGNKHKNLWEKFGNLFEKNSEENCCLLCKKCNGMKANHTPLELAILMYSSNDDLIKFTYDFPESPYPTTERRKEKLLRKRIKKSHLRYKDFAKNIFSWME